MTADLKRLPLLEPHRGALEKCVYCPKLCRAACPVSNAEPNESIIPWGKMSAAFFMARGDVAITAQTASVAWACTDCGACAERCDHKNPVGDVLLDSRADLFERHAAPAAALSVVDAWQQTTRERHAALDRIGEAAGAAPNARAKLLLGCAYARYAPEEAALAVQAARELLGEEVALARGCCGQPLLAAGDASGFRREAEALARELAPAHPVVVLDPGCQRTLTHHCSRAQLPVASSTLLLDLAAAAIDRLQPATDLPPVRYHDPCQLGRGLGKYDAPRAILAKVTGAAPLEFDRARQHADCSGAGSLLPITRPAASAEAAAIRLAQHADHGGGPLVTACASSLRRFRESREEGAVTNDLVHYIARGLGIRPKGPTETR